MPRSIAITSSSPMPMADRPAMLRASRLAYETLTLTMGCAAAVGMTLALYLTAPIELRQGIVTAFLGFDQPTISLPSNPPLSL